MLSIKLIPFYTDKAALGDCSSLYWMNGIIFNVSLETGNPFDRAQRSPAALCGVERLTENYKPSLPWFVMNGSGQGFHFGFPECALAIYSYGGSHAESKDPKKIKIIHSQLFIIQTKLR